jgi:hypothetical protein
VTVNFRVHSCEGAKALVSGSGRVRSAIFGWVTKYGIPFRNQLSKQAPKRRREEEVVGIDAGLLLEQLLYGNDRMTTSGGFSTAGVRT